MEARLEILEKLMEALRIVTTEQMEYLHTVTREHDTRLAAIEKNHDGIGDINMCQQGLTVEGEGERTLFGVRTTHFLESIQLYLGPRNQTE